MPIKWQPFKESEGLDGLDFNGREREGWVPFLPGFPTNREEPAMDIYQDKENLYVEMPLPGIKPENVEISIEENILSVQGKITEEEEKKETDYIHREVRKGSFRRMIKLPIEVRGEKAAAEFSNGVLKVTAPKVTKVTSKAKKILIKVK